MYLPRVIVTAFVGLLFGLASYAQENHALQESVTSDPWRQDAVEYFRGSECVAHQVIVKFSQAGKSLTRLQRQQAELTSVIDLVKQQDIARHRPFVGIGAHLFESRSKDVATLMAEISGRPDILYVQPNYIGHQADTIPNDPDFNQLWAFRNTGTPGADISAVKAWDILTGTKANDVAIIDSGIWIDSLGTGPIHPDLAGNIWSSTKAFDVSLASGNYHCVLGAHGFDTFDKPESCTASSLEDGTGHGTAVAGIIGATGNNLLGVVGVNWTASLMILRTIGSAGSIAEADAVDAVEFVRQANNAGAANVKVINASWFFGDPLDHPALKNEIATVPNILFVAAAGNGSNNNDTAPIYPANFGAAGCRFHDGSACYLPSGFLWQ